MPGAFDVDAAMAALETGFGTAAAGTGGIVTTPGALGLGNALYIRV